MEKARERCDGCWDRIKQHSGMIMIVGSMILFIFGCFFLIAGAYIGATFTTQTEEGAVIAAIISGVLLILYAILGGVAFKKGHGCFTYLLFAAALLLFIGGLVIVGIALTYLKRIEAITGIPPPVAFSQNITDAGQQEVSDYINSIFVTCCTGCPESVCGKLINNTQYCANQLTSPNPQCDVIPACPEAPSNLANCFFSTGENNTLPPVEVGEGICTFLEGAAWGEFNTPVVGNLGTDPRKVSCGGGDAKIFAFSVRDWLFAQYAWISAIIGIILFILFAIMVASLAYDRKSREDYKPKRIQEYVCSLRFNCMSTNHELICYQQPNETFWVNAQQVMFLLGQYIIIDHLFFKAWNLPSSRLLPATHTTLLHIPQAVLA